MEWGVARAAVDHADEYAHRVHDVGARLRAEVEIGAAFSPPAGSTYALIMPYFPFGLPTSLVPIVDFRSNIHAGIDEEGNHWKEKTRGMGRTTFPIL